MELEFLSQAWLNNDIIIHIVLLVPVLVSAFTCLLMMIASG